VQALFTFIIIDYAQAINFSYNWVGFLRPLARK
jgi:hypothetical protein